MLVFLNADGLAADTVSSQLARYPHRHHLWNSTVPPETPSIIFSARAVLTEYMAI